MIGGEVSAVIDHESAEGRGIQAGAAGKIVLENADSITVDFGEALDGEKIEISYPVEEFAQYCDDGQNQQVQAPPQSLRDRARAAPQQQQQTNDMERER